ncbi:unnamed protein product [Spodoptera exigua]|nr:unnamed protein product [Spodoptera exigua]
MRHRDFGLEQEKEQGGFNGDTKLNWRVRVGSSFANSGGIVHTVSAIFVHPNFNQRIIDNDVAILRTTNFIEYGNAVQPASIAGSFYNLPDNAVVWAAGWGTTSKVGGRRITMRVFIALLGCIAAVTAVPAFPQRIVGGSLTTVDQYPTIVSLLFSWSATSFFQNCGGTIITNRAILTAAHCPFRDSALSWRVRAGSSYANSGGTVYALDSIIINPNYNTWSMDFDVAIMRTSQVISFNSVVKAASVAGPNYNLADNQVVWAAGWGTTSSGGPASEQLRHVQIWTVNQIACRDRYAAGGATITDNMLCSGVLDVGGRDQCQGDSGGPLYHNGIVVGVCSWGFGCAQPQYPGVNARVSRFSSWIQANA